MSDREFYFLILGVILATFLLNRREEVEDVAATREEVAEQDQQIFGAILQSLLAMLLLGTAAIATLVDLNIAYRLLVLREPCGIGPLLLLPALLVVSILFTWYALVELLGYQDLPKFLGRFCGSIIRYFHRLTPDASKKKSPGHNRDLD